MDTITLFSAATGLKASPTKCRVYFGGVDENVQQRILSITGFLTGSLPFKYLGVPLMNRSLNVNVCRPLIDRITSKITHWTARLPSYAGKQQLVKSVLFAITNYWMQVFHLPKCVTKHIEAMCRSFVWSGKAEITRKAPVSWKKICEPKNAGGLNITSLNEWNIATLGKLHWNIESKADKMWVNIYYIKDQNFLLWWTRVIWAQMLHWIGYHHNPGIWQYEKQWLTMEANKKGWRRQILKAAATELVYALWQNRNSIIFAQGTRDDHVLDRVKFIVYTRCSRHRIIITHFDENTLCIE
ncbi:uncharacterized protein LOC131613225 [Vicia villosa]|uniref:uncharacterized protein LOC131613225 n=1 Tax=Vicia villosa TaxID=3911 RepID=UPI00273C69E2|nr:uncharacterized protein LOC131613225 [Vicia villosa]